MFLLTKITSSAILAPVLLISVLFVAADKAQGATKTTSHKSSTEAASAHAKVKGSVASHRSSKSSVRDTAVTAHRGRRARIRSAAATKPKFRGQQSIDQARTTEIQQALIREHYLNGEPTGEWDQATRDALSRFQGDNHWQTKIIPDSRALIKLGLGPSRQNLLNPESAAIAPPYQAGIEKSVPGGSN